MPELRWILLGLGILFFAGLWWWETHRRRQAVDRTARSEPVIGPVTGVSADAPPEAVPDERTEPAVESGPAASDQEPSAEDDGIVSLRLFAPPAQPFAGVDLKQALQAEGLRFGEFSIFHKHGPAGERLFSVANLLQPGSFDPQDMDGQVFKGIVLFAVRQEAGEAGLTEMRRVAESLAARLDGRLGSPG